MNWLQKTSQSQNSILSANFEIQTQKTGLVSVGISCSFHAYNRWELYKLSGQGINDRQIGGEEEHNRSIEMEPDCRLTISHEASGWMPDVNVPENSYDADVFEMVENEMTNLQNDNFEEIIKIKDFGEKVRSWLFMPSGGDRNNRRVHQEEYKEVDFQLGNELFGAKEELYQQWIRLSR